MCERLHVPRRRYDDDHAGSQLRQGLSPGAPARAQPWRTGQLLARSDHDQVAVALLKPRGIPGAARWEGIGAGPASHASLHPGAFKMSGPQRSGSPRWLRTMQWDPPLSWRQEGTSSLPAQRAHERRAHEHWPETPYAHQHSETLHDAQGISSIQLCHPIQLHHPIQLRHPCAIVAIQLRHPCAIVDIQLRHPCAVLEDIEDIRDDVEE